MRHLRGLGFPLLLMSVAACRQDADTTGENRPTPLPLTSEQCEAIRVAERFVLENGYTKAPATVDRSRIAWELGDDPLHLERVLEIRHDTLKPHAYGLRLGVSGDPLAWEVVFEYTDRLTALATLAEGRPREADGAVVRVKVEPGGSRAVQQHTPMFLSGVTRLGSPEEVSATCAAVEKKP